MIKCKKYHSDNYEVRIFRYCYNLSVHENPTSSRGFPYLFFKTKKQPQMKKIFKHACLFTHMSLLGHIKKKHNTKYSLHCKYIDFHNQTIELCQTESNNRCLITELYQTPIELYRNFLISWISLMTVCCSIRFDRMFNKFDRPAR